MDFLPWFLRSEAIEIPNLNFKCSACLLSALEESLRQFRVDWPSFKFPSLLLAIWQSAIYSVNFTHWRSRFCDCWGACRSCSAKAHDNWPASIQPRGKRILLTMPPLLHILPASRCYRRYAHRLLNDRRATLPVARPTTRRRIDELKWQMNRGVHSESIVICRYPQIEIV